MMKKNVEGPSERATPSASAGVWKEIKHQNKEQPRESGPPRVIKPPNGWLFTAAMYIIFLLCKPFGG